MLRTENDATNLPQIRGTGEEHLRYFIENRLNYCDSKWYAGDYPEDNAVVRIYTPVDENGVPLTDLAIPANANITVTPYSNMYAGVRYKANGTLMQERLEANETYTFVAPNETFNDTETAIYGASQLSSLGDLAPLYLGYIDVGAATKLVELKIGDGTEGYKNANLYHLAVGTNRLLKKIDIQNCDSPRFVQALVLSGCPNIEEVYAKGSSITGVELPDSGYLKILQLPATITNLTLKNQPYIEDLTIEGYENLKTITIENCPVVNSLDILDKAVNVERVRLTNVDWHYDDASILYELIDRDIAGIDENGVNTDTMWVDGKCNIETLTGSEYAEIKSLYPYLEITYTTLISQLTYMSEDGTEELHRETIYNGGNGTDPVENGTIETPTKESTPQYDYTFGGWSLTPNSEPNPNALKNVEADRIVYVAFNKTLRNYTVRFMNGSTVETSKVVAYGTNASPCKKNLFNSKAFVGNGVTNNSLGSITLSSYISFFNNMLDVACLNLAVGETYVWSGNNLNDIYFGGVVLKPNVPFVLTEEMLEKNTLGFYALKSTSSSALYTITNMQLELGDTPTVYEAYSIITPVNNSTGNIEDFEFIGWKPEPTNIQGDTDCYAQYYDTREIMDDWTTIATACLDGTATDKYAIGAYKMLDIGAAELPYDFYEGGAVVYNGEIHILGNDTSHYKWNGSEWTEVSTLPTKEYYSKNSTVVYNNEIHLIDDDGKHYKWNGSEWELVSTFDFKFHYGSAVVLNNEIHVLGGYGTAWNHYKWNGSEWTQVSVPNMGNGSRCVVYNNEIHIFGGIEHYKWNGTEWVYVSRIPASINADYPVVCNNEIHIIIATKHYAWNGSEWRLIHSFDYSVRYNSIVELDGKIYVLGCRDRKRLFIQYSPETSKWSSVGTTESIPMEVIAHNHDELADGVNKWERINTVDTYTPMYEGGCVVYKNEIHYLGNSATNNKHYKFDGNTWSEVAGYPYINLRNPSVVVYNDEIHVLGGANTTTSHFKFDGNTWQEVGVLPIGLIGACMAVVYNNEIHALLHGTSTNTQPAPHYKFDGISWTEVGETPNLTWSNVGMFVYDSEIHVINKNQHFKFDGSSWITIETNLSSTAKLPIVCDSELYVLDEDRSMSVWRNSVWERVGVLPYTSIYVFSCGAVVYNNEIYLPGNGMYTTPTKAYKWSTASWEVDENIPVTPFNITAMHMGWYFEINNELHAISEKFYYKWDGTEWVDMNPTTNSDIVQNLLITRYNEEFYGIESNSSTGIIYKFDGNTWIDSGLRSPYPSSFNQGSFLTYNGELHILSGYSSGTANLHYKYDGTDWVSVSTLPVACYGNSVVYDDAIYIGRASYNAWYKWDGTEWAYVCDTPFIHNRTRKFYTVCDDEIHMYTNDCNHYKYDGNEWILVGSVPTTAPYFSFLTTYRGRVCMINSANGNTYVFRNPRATLTFLAKNALNETKSLGQDFSSWSDSTLHTFVNDTLFGSLPSMLRDNIKEVVKMCDGGYENQIITTLNERCWIPSATELGFDSVDSINNYYLQGQGDAYPVFTDGLSRVRTSSDGISKIWYFTRTSDCSDNTKWIFVIHTGAANRTAKISNQSVVFGFCI